jgi:hypothetical protein
MLLDIIGSIFAVGLYATVVGVLVGLSPLRVGIRLAVFAAAGAWLGVVVAVAALGGLMPGVLGRVPANLLPFGGLLVLLFGSWFFLPRFRSALLSVPLPALVGIHAGRLGGLFFLLVYADGRLSAPFAPVAGIGDMVTGTLAIPLAAMLALGFSMHRTWLGLWNAFGALDLVAAVLLGLLSAPGTPFRVLIDGPGTEALTTLPWALIPAMLVPIFLLVHFTVAVKLRAASLGRLAIV